jgi:peptidoglycan/xylan/chitin deacetylase (PgdA/CDA1 family)
MLAAKELGHELVSHDVLRKGLSQPTLKQVTSQLAGGGNYIIGLRGHWLALVNGQLVDNDNNSGMTSRVIEVFEVRKVQAIAA